MKKAFTMIELIMVIVLVGIISSIAVSKINTKSDLLSAAEMYANDIRYTRILALSHDTYGEKNKSYYGITITSSGVYKITPIGNRANSTTFVKEDYVLDYQDSSKLFCDFPKEDICLNKSLKDYNPIFTETTPSIGTHRTNIILFNELGEPLNYDLEPSGFTVELKKTDSNKACIYIEKSGFVNIKKGACK